MAHACRPSDRLLNGSLIYTPTVILLLAVSLFHGAKGKRDPIPLLGATAAFFAALVFRTIDNVLCPSFPVGTHFLWHLCIGPGVASRHQDFDPELASKGAPVSCCRRL
jgi:hypothetical protein